MNEITELALVTLIQSGALIPVEVFGTCGHPVELRGKTDTCADDEHWSYGLCDRFSRHSIAGSACYRAAAFIFRPSDALMDAHAVRAAIAEVVDEGVAWE